MCVGQAASMGALLLAGGAKGKRHCLPHSRMMIHQPLGGFQGQAVRHRHPRQGNPAHPRTSERDSRLATPGNRSTGFGPIPTATGSWKPDEAREYGLVDEVLQARETSPRLRRRLTCAAVAGANHEDNPNNPNGERQARQGRQRRPAAVLLVLRQEPARGAEADRRPVGVHLRRVRRSLQ